MVDWDFLHSTMARALERNGRVGFMAFSSARFSVLINGSTNEFFKSSRGLHQGCPLSPMLFVIMVEDLHFLLEKAQLRNLLNGFFVENASLEVTDLQFADDTVIFCGASLNEVKNLKCILRWFEIIPGLKLTMKSVRC